MRIKILFFGLVFLLASCAIQNKSPEASQNEANARRATASFTFKDNSIIEVWEACVKTVQEPYYFPYYLDEEQRKISFSTRNIDEIRSSKDPVQAKGAFRLTVTLSEKEGEVILTCNSSGPGGASRISQPSIATEDPRQVVLLNKSEIENFLSKVEKRLK